MQFYCDKDAFLRRYYFRGCSQTSPLLFHALFSSLNHMSKTAGLNSLASTCCKQQQTSLKSSISPFSILSRARNNSLSLSLSPTISLLLCFITFNSLICSTLIGFSENICSHSMVQSLQFGQPCDFAGSSWSMSQGKVHCSNPGVWSLPCFLSIGECDSYLFSVSLCCFYLVFSVLQIISQNVLK